jgi:hypothetical protein
MPRARLPFALLQWSRTDFEGLSLTLPSGGGYAVNNDEGKVVLDAFFLGKAFSEPH